MEEAIKKIIEAGIQAPSAENCQPWRFSIRGHEVYLFHVPDRGDWDKRSSLIAQGAVIENMQIAASHFGYKAEINLLPQQEENLVAIISLRKEGESQKESLYPYIEQRITNRKPYKTIPLTDEQRTLFLNTSKEIGTGRIILIEDESQKNLLAHAVATHEQIVFENQILHKDFFSNITWTEKEDLEKRTGFYIQTFEIPPPARVMFKLASSWSLLQKFNMLGFSKMIAKQNASTYSSTAAMGAIVFEENTPRDFILAGRILERLWLKVTQVKLSMQPFAGVTLIAQQLLANEKTQLLPSQRELLLRTYDDIKKIFNISNKTVVILFRIGNGESPSAQARRLDFKNVTSN